LFEKCVQRQMGESKEQEKGSSENWEGAGGQKGTEKNEHG